MDTFFCIIKAIVGYFILLLVSTNLLGMIVRGIRQTPTKENEGDFTSTKNLSSNSNITMTIVISLISILYFYVLYHYWNVGILAAGIILMFTRLPDLLFEMRTGERINSRNIPKRPIDILCSVLSWLTIPLIWYSLCYIE